MTKQGRYYYDADAVRTPASPNPHPRRKDGTRQQPRGHDPNDNRSSWQDTRTIAEQAEIGTNLRSVCPISDEPLFDDSPYTEPAPEPVATHKMPDNWDTGPGAHGRVHRDGRQKGERRDRQRGASRRHAGFSDRWDLMTLNEQQAAGGNLRSVWPIATRPFTGAHFATFPPQLARIPILAGTSEHGVCAACAAPWQRITEVTYDNPANRTTNGPRSIEHRDVTAGFEQRLERRSDTVGWEPTCDCHCPDTVPATVLDPFGGAGTVGLIADQLGRDSILCEISTEYAELTAERIRTDAPLFAEVELSL